MYFDYDIVVTLLNVNHISQKVTNVDLLLDPKIQCLRKNYENFTKFML